MPLRVPALGSLCPGGEHCFWPQAAGVKRQARAQGGVALSRMFAAPAAGAPLISSEGYVMGSLGILDLEPRKFPADM